LLVDAERNPVEVEPLLEEEGAEEGKEGGVEELPPDSPSVSGGRTSILPDVCDKKVAFEIAIEREGGREEGEEDEDEDEDEGEGGRKGWHKEGWTVWRTYEDFDDLHAALLARFFPEEGREGWGEGGCPLKRPNYIGLREGRAKEQGKVLLRVVDVVSDMRSLSQYLSQVLALRLQCQELRDFLVEEEEEEEEDKEGREEGVVLKEEGVGEGGGKEMKKGKEEEEGEEGGREEGKEGLALRQVYLGMRKSVPAEEHHVRLRTFKVRRKGGREGRKAWRKGRREGVD